MEVMLTEQTRTFIYVCVLGAALGFFYDFLHLIRILLNNSKIATYILDILFCICCAAAFFSFCLMYQNGEVRGFAVIGCILGASLYFFAVSPYFISISEKFGIWLQGFGRRILSIMKKIPHFRKKN